MKLPQIKNPFARPPRQQPKTDAVDQPGAHRVKKQKKKRIPKALLIAGIAVAAAGILLVRPMLTGGAAAAPSAFAEGTVARKDIRTTLSSTGTIAPANQYDVTASVRGEVLSADFEEGDAVQKGDPLYEIDKSEAQSSIAQAELSLRQSQNSYAQTAQSVSDLTVKADSAGVVTKLHVKAGEQVQSGAAIADIRDASTMELTVPFNAADADTFGIGAAATVTMDGSFETLTGTVSAVDAVETVLDGYQIVKNVTIRVTNPGGLSTSSAATASVGGVACNQGASFRYLNETTITASASGKIVSLHISEGAAVSKNQAVATLSSDSVENQVKNSALSLEQSELSYQKTVDALDDYTIKAPIDGTVITKNIKVGDTLDTTNGQTVLAVIYDLSYLTFDISLDELDVSKVAVGQTVDIACDSIEAGSFAGRVTKVSVAGTTANGVTTYPVTVQIDDPPEGLLPGMNVNATIVVAEAAGALTVSVAAVQRGNMVYIKDEGAKNTEQTMVGGTVLPDGWKAVSVTTGLSDENNIEILSGLAEGDVVYVPESVRTSSERQDMQQSMQMGMAGGSMPAGGAPPNGMNGGGGGMP